MNQLNLLTLSFTSIILANSNNCQEKKMSELKLVEIIYSLSDKCTAHRKKHLKELGLLKAEFKGLICMDKERKITCKDFAKRMGLSLSRVSRIIDRLYKKNYILRIDSRSDRRCKMIYLTKKGKYTQNKIERIMEQCEQKLTSDMADDKLNPLKRELLDLIQKL